MSRSTGRLRGRYLVVAVLAVVAITFGVAGPWAYATLVDTSAKDRIEADPPPPLFPDDVVAPIGRRTAAQAVVARRLMAGWWDRHDRAPHDAQFVAWVERTLPGPPDAARRDAELEQVRALAPRRTPAGTAAATWLELYGKKDVWKLAVHDQGELLSQPEGDRRKQELDDALKVAKDVADTLGTKYQQSAPYVIDPSLRPDHTVTQGQVCPCSYPSRHAAAAAAARTFLSFLAPHRAAEYRWTEAEIDYSRVYMAGHVPSDITGGALLGDMIGEYFLVTRHHVGQRVLEPAAPHSL
jgi:hypothetical protein